MLNIKQIYSVTMLLISLPLSGSAIPLPNRPLDPRLYPEWWLEYDVVSTNSINDKALVNQGQMKWIARQAYEAIEDHLPGPGNMNIHQITSSFTDENNYLPVNIGQLKQLAAPFFNRLFEYGLAGAYPWDDTNQYKNDYAIATVQDAKKFFNFDLPASTNFYYVDPDGSDNNPGTLIEPFRTIQHVADLVSPGDTVLIRDGIYREQVTLITSGTEEHPITFMGYADEFPTIKGSEIVTNWVHYQDNIWMVTNWLMNSQQVFVQGTPLQQIGYPHAYFSANPWRYRVVGLGRSDLYPGSFFYDETNHILYICLNNNSVPSECIIEVSVRTGTFSAIDIPYIKIKDLKFSHSTDPFWASMVHIGPSSIITHCDIQWADFTGVELQNNSQAIHCTIANNGAVGIEAAMASNILVYGCHVLSNNYRNFNMGWHAGGMKFIPDASGSIINNIVEQNNGTGIWFDNCNSEKEISISNNKVFNNARHGIEVEVSQNAKVYNNLVIGNSSGICIFESQDVTVLNNTVSKTHGTAAIYAKADWLRLTEGHRLGNNQICNNILYNNSSTYDIRIPDPSKYIFNNNSDYNCFYNEDELVTYNNITHKFYDLETWSSQTGQDVHSIQLPPYVLNPNLNNYALAANSPCVNMGTNLPVVFKIPYDLANHHRVLNGVIDIGCYEFDGSDTLMAPSIQTSAVKGLIPHDVYNLTGTMNANVTGTLSALITSQSTTNFITNISSGPYIWNLDISDFEVETEYTITLYGTNDTGTLTQQSLSLTRGSPGTGTPIVSITNTPLIHSTSGPITLIGTNNVHTADVMTWSNFYNNAWVQGGHVISSNGSWRLEIQNISTGRNTIWVYGTNDWNIEAADSIAVECGNTTNHYVSLESPDPTYPFITWNTAAMTIQEAVDAASDGDTVYVSNGLYKTGFIQHAYGRTRVMLDKGITIESMGGPDHTFILGQDKYARCIIIDHTNAAIVGFTLTEGYADLWNRGGGALIFDMSLMSNCIITQCSSPYTGGGITLWGQDNKGHGMISSCVISSNSANYTGGVEIQWGKNLTLKNCVIRDNTATYRGGGMRIDNCFNVWNCLVVNNHAGSSGGGVVLGNGSKLYNCTVENNQAPLGGGIAVYPGGSASIYNSIFAYNYPENFDFEMYYPENTYNIEYCSTTLLHTNVTSTKGSMTSDPKYLYPYGNDYRLGCHSPCLNIGATLNWMQGEMDLSGTNRILFETPDIGCYEFDDTDELYEPYVEAFCSTGMISYDQQMFTAFGGRNILTTNMTVFFSNGSTNEELSVSYPGKYDWTVGTVELVPMVTNSFILIGMNSYFSTTSTFSVVRGGIGTGTPVLAITNQLAEIISSNQVIRIEGTNNLHVVSTGGWELEDDEKQSYYGPVNFKNNIWGTSFTNLNTGTYTFEINGSNLWDIATMDSITFEVQ